MKPTVQFVWKRVIGCFLAGLFTILPLIITVGVVVWVSGFIEGIIGPNTLLGGLLRSLGLRFAGGSNTLLAYAIGWAFVLGTVFLVGVMVELGAKKLFRRMADLVLRHVPLIGGIYNTSRQLVDMMDTKDQADVKGMSVVFCFFGKRPGAGVLALLASPERFRILDTDYHIVIIPTSPVPIGGGMVFVPVDHVVPADMSVDGLMSIYVSMGVTAPQFMTVQPPPAP